MRLAAIDLGTNSFHLLIAETHPDGSFRVVTSEKEIVRIGWTGDGSGFLSPDSIERGYRALEYFKTVINTQGVTHVRAIATSAIREATNQSIFIEKVRSKLGIGIEVVSGVEEGRLIYLGVLQSLQLFNNNSLIIDVGGGSTEYVIGKKAVPKYSVSLQLGAIRISERFQLSSRVTEKQIEKARKYIRGKLSTNVIEMRRRGFDSAIATSGTAHAIAGVIAHIHSQKNENIGNHINGFTFSYTDAKDALRAIIKLPTTADRKKYLGIDERRADIIIGGSLILIESMGMLHINKLTVSQYALREGIVYDYLHARFPRHYRRHPILRDIREQSVRQLCQQCNYDQQHAERVAKFADEIFLSIQRLHSLGDKERQHLRYASLLHEIGYHISHSEYHLHSYYIIRNCGLSGFTNSEVEIIANIARYHRKSHPKMSHEGYNRLQRDEHRSIVRKLASILRLAVNFDRGNTGAVRAVETKVGKKTVEFLLKPIRGNKRGIGLEIWGAERNKMLFEKVYAREVSFREV